MSEVLGEALSRLEAYEDLVKQRGESDPAATKLFDEPIEVNLQLLTEQMADPAVAKALDEHLAGFESSRGELEAEQLAQLEASSEHRLAVLYQNIGTFSITETFASDNETATADEFLERDARIVSKQLIGKKLSANGTTVTIIETRGQNRELNEKYLSSRPIFGPDRKDAYVAAVRGGFMLFLKAGSAKNADSCVAITGIELADGTTVNKPMAAAKAMGFDRDAGMTSEMVGTARLDDEILVLDLVERPKN